MKEKIDAFNPRATDLAHKINGRPIHEQLAFDDMYEALISAKALISDVMDVDAPDSMAVAIVGAALFKAAHADRRLIEPDPQKDVLKD